MDNLIFAYFTVKNSLNIIKSAIKVVYKKEKVTFRNGGLK